MKRFIAIWLILFTCVTTQAQVKLSNLTATWNNGATVFEAIKMDITDTASAAGSSALWLGFSATEVFRVDKDGTIYASAVAMPTISSTSTFTNKTIVAANNTLTLFAGGANNQLLTDDGSGGLVSESALTFNGTDFGIISTWNDAGNIFDALSVDVTNTASASNSTLIRLTIDGNDVFSVTRTGMARVQTGAGTTLRLGDRKSVV